ncbi:Uncharacterized protein OS=Sorangium cellulosum (strain So ce56) GN=sce5710 PE=4 SV=1 [Gemmata massiliana]|uniref:Uncharacterized protein n=2 Tax=Gemmata massiliana TaxID=1210884 RepID=A0A6P2D4W0_9BACT|nr:Uncharacterized protein OS=Sorangium cellulosum (strain So ce56) GN=sce5710 PE=4 SV=1 [Gemmata massiliana]
MDEHQWLTGTNPREMLKFLQGNASKRKQRLFGCACCRRVWNAFVPPHIIRIVTAAEAFADGEINDEELARLHSAARAAWHDVRTESSDTLGYLAHIEICAVNVTSKFITVAGNARQAAANAAADLPITGPEPGDEYLPEYVSELAAQADLMRDIFGNPFGSLEIQLEWLTETVLSLARGIYSDRAFDRMPILADALQDAGCDDEVILAHCRERGEHARGCWVIDLLLGKQ